MRLLLALALALVACCTCGRRVQELPARFNPELADGRLEIVSRQNSVWLSCWILRDTRTGAEYLVVRSGQGLAISKM